MKKQSGFTLIELVVAMAVLGLIMGQWYICLVAVLPVCM